MAIVKATYTKKIAQAKASIRYIAHRPGREGTKTSRILFNSDGALGRWQAYRMIEQAEKGSVFFRFVISPDPRTEDGKKDVHLRDVAMQTMQALQERLQKAVLWVGVEHSDHTPHRHLHVVAVVPERLDSRDFAHMRTITTQACQEQRRARDATRDLVQEPGEEAQLEYHR